MDFTGFDKIYYEYKKVCGEAWNEKKFQKLTQLNKSNYSIWNQSSNIYTIFFFETEHFQISNSQQNLKKLKINRMLSVFLRKKSNNKDSKFFYGSFF